MRITRSSPNQGAIGGRAGAEIVITRHGKPAGVLIRFKNEDDWFEYRLEHHPELLRRVSEARQALAAGRGVRLEDIDA